MKNIMFFLLLFSQYSFCMNNNLPKMNTKKRWLVDDKDETVNGKYNLLKLEYNNLKIAEFILEKAHGDLIKFKGETSYNEAESRLDQLKLEKSKQSEFCQKIQSKYRKIMSKCSKRKIVKKYYNNQVKIYNKIKNDIKSIEGDISNDESINLNIEKKLSETLFNAQFDLNHQQMLVNKAEKQFCDACSDF